LPVSLTARAQTSGNKIRPEITNSKTSKHFNRPGPKLYIIPPPGFETGKLFAVLQKGHGQLLIICDVEGGNFCSSTGAFNKTALKKKE
jgi:hypothetical protein